MTEQPDDGAVLDATTRLWLPPGRVWNRWSSPGISAGEPWRAYTVEMFGCVFAQRVFEGDWAGGPVSPRGWPPSSVGLIFEGPHLYRVAAYELYQVIVRHSLFKSWYEWSWDPIRGEAAGVLGPTPKRRERAIVDRGRLLVEYMTARVGRPTGSLLYATDFLDRLERALTHLKRQHMQITRKAVIATEWLNEIDTPGTLDEHLVAHGYHWETDIKPGGWLRDRLAAKPKVGPPRGLNRRG